MLQVMVREKRNFSVDICIYLYAFDHYNNHYKVNKIYNILQKWNQNGQNGMKTLEVENGNKI